jgi:undecaprenyl-diphosphatase
MSLFKKSFKSILIFSGCFCFCFYVTAQPAEVKLLDNLNPQQPSSEVIKGFTNSVYPVGLASSAALLATGYIQKDKALQLKGWEVAGSLAINVVITRGMKHIINRTRPYDEYPLLIYPYQIEKRSSFPSGHTSTAFATATILSLQFKKWYVIVPAYTYATIIGYSRMYQGVHYPTDVIGGAAVGAGSAVLSHWLTRKMFNNK